MGSSGINAVPHGLTECGEVRGPPNWDCNIAWQHARIRAKRADTIILTRATTKKLGLLLLPFGSKVLSTASHFEALSSQVGPQIASRFFVVRLTKSTCKLEK